MDPLPSVPEYGQNENPKRTNLVKNIQYKISNLSKTKKITLLLVSLLVLSGILFLIYFLSQNKNLGENPTKSFTKSDKSSLPDNLIAKVGETPIYKSYLETELKLYPATPTAEIKKMLTDKIIDDQIAIDYGIEQGLVDSYHNSESLNEEQYIERTKEVQKVKREIEGEAQAIHGTIVSAWFFNNGKAGPLGLEKGKETVYAKIKPLYDSVKSGNMSIEQAGKRIKDDKSLETIDPAYEANALSSFKFTKEQKRLTFWPEFDELIKQTPEGGITPLYLGKDRDSQGNPVDQLYIFARIDKIIKDKDFGDYRQWLKQQKSKINIQIGLASPLPQNISTLLSRVSAFFNVYADDDNNNGGGHGGVPQKWYGYVTSQTGAPISGATIRMLNTVSDSCPSQGDRSTSSDGNGYYEFGADEKFSCWCNANYIRVSYNGQQCGEAKLMIANVYTEVSHTDFVCNVPPPPPPPPPVNRCGQACSSRADCENAKDNCSFCVPNLEGSGSSCQTAPQCGSECTSDQSCADALNGCIKCLPSQDGSGKKTCQTPPPPIQCGSPCTTDQNCTDALNGCNVCLPNPNGSSNKICSKPPACGTKCISSEGCVAAKDGCTQCINDGASGAKCDSCPAGMNYDPKELKCVCPNPGETNPHGVCDGDKCTQVNSCGITECTTDKQCFAEEMCKCDGFEATQLEYPSSKPFTFSAFAKVEGTDIRKAMVEGIRFKMSESDKSNPNAGTIIAQSPMYTPEVVSSSSAKVRFKATWNLTPPQIKANKVYRVFSEIKCAPKKKRAVADASDIRQYQSKVAGVATANAAEQSPSPSPDYLQLKTLNLIKKGQTDNCRFLFFEYEPN